MGRDFVDDDLMRSRNAAPRLNLGLDNTRRDGFIPSSKEHQSKPIDDLGLTALAGRQKTRRGVDPSSAIAELAELETQKAEMEEERQLLEELYEKQKLFEEGRTALLAMMDDSAACMAKEENAITLRSESLQAARELFAERRTQLEAIQEEEWEGTAVIDELDRAIAFISTARRECEETMHHVQACAPKESRRTRTAAASTALSGSFVAVMLQGLAFFLPVMIFLFLLFWVGMVVFLKFA